MSENINKLDNSEQEIDLIELIGKLWNSRWLILKTCFIGGIMGVIIAFSIPKEYTTTVILATESRSGSMSNMGALAAIAGINLQQNSSEMSPELYPDIVKSTPFLLGLLDLQVLDTEQGIDTNLYSYLSDFQRKTWWSYVLGFPFQILKWLHSEKKEDKESSNQKIISLTKEQEEVVKKLNDKISVSVDKKTGVITLRATSQSAIISASLVDTLSSYMQNYIINYRTEKARQDLAFTQKLYDEVQEEYYKAQQAHAGYIDKNHGIISASFRTTQERLQNEMNLAYNVYNQMAQQLQMAKIKVQDITPVCTVIQPAVKPLQPSAPKKRLILIGIVFLTFAGTCAWILFVKDLFSRFKNKDI